MIDGDFNMITSASDFTLREQIQSGERYADLRQRQAS